jgi:hypothetical protein
MICFEVIMSKFVDVSAGLASSLFSFLLKDCAFQLSSLSYILRNGKGELAAAGKRVL